MQAAYDRQATEGVPEPAHPDAGGGAAIPDASIPVRPVPTVVVAPMWEARLLARFLALSGHPPLDIGARIRCLNTIKFMGSCGYSMRDVCVVLAHASVYFCDVLARCGRRMNANEASNIVVALVYIAHSYVLDETCPLSYWHRHLATGYCELKVLDAAVVRLMKMRGYILRVDQQDVHRRCEVFLFAATTHRSASTVATEHAVAENA